MRVSDYRFDLPDSLIARYPTEVRTSSRLLQLSGETGELNHRSFEQILDLVTPGDLMVFNNTRVIAARVFGQKASGGKLEILVERLLTPYEILAHVRSSKSPKVGSDIVLGTDKDESVPVRMLGR